MRPVARGDRGKEVVDIQTRLRALGHFLGQEGADGHFGANTERATLEFQQARLLLADGVVGENTWTELVEAGYLEGERLLYLRVPFMRGDDVLHLQRRLNELGFDSGPEDGIFGPLTETALTDFQRNVGLNVDGILGEASLAQLCRVRKAELGSQGKKIPDRMNGYVGSASIEGMKVVLDPGHGGTDFGGRGPGGLLEKDVNLDLARRLARLLREAGAEVVLSRDGDRALGLYERVRLANSIRPDLHVCLHHESVPSRRARGAATFYFANGAYFAEAGKRLAGYVVKALVEELGRIDLHTHGRNFVCLREIQGLSLLVEPGYVSHPEEGATLADPAVVEAEARAILRGIECYIERR
ncbi:MAG: N-acetylmuramoyl-L-alanine amidase [Thermoleophilia bacterium]|nr:N-acetylmuramoyl-L-alanine amidase [Thermoleophilia bacterium]